MMRKRSKTKKGLPLTRKGSRVSLNKKEKEVMIGEREEKVGSVRA